MSAIREFMKSPDFAPFCDARIAEVARIFWHLKHESE
jgi:hypothetical protein